MRINADFSLPALVVPAADAWIESPETGVDRLMLDRIGGEVARATSLVRYAAGSSFPEHRHPLGEEFLVLDGVFSDEHADYPAGTYVRNPPGTSHAPSSRDGCRIFVKLRQFDPDDLEPVVVDTSASEGWSGSVPARLHLHRHGSEHVEMLRLSRGEVFEFTAPDGGAEILIVKGTLEVDGESLPSESWLRMPAGATRLLAAGKNAVLWTKTGHLPDRDDA